MINGAFITNNTQSLTSSTEKETHTLTDGLLDQGSDALYRVQIPSAISSSFLVFWIVLGVLMMIFFHHLPCSEDWLKDHVNSAPTDTHTN